MQSASQKKMGNKTMRKNANKEKMSKWECEEKTRRNE